MPENEGKLFLDDQAIADFVSSLSFEDCLVMLLTMIDIGKAERARKKRLAELAEQETETADN